MTTPTASETPKDEMRRFTGARFGGPVDIKNVQAWAKQKPEVLGTGSPFFSRELESPYRQVSRVFACITEITKAFRMGRLRFRTDEDPDAPDVPEDHPLAVLFRRPFPGINPRNMMNAWSQYLLLDGEALTIGLDANYQPVRTYGEGPDALMELPRHLFVFRGGDERLQLESKRGVPQSWSITGARGAFNVAVGAAALIREDDPDRPFRGCGPMKAAWGPAMAVYVTDLLNTSTARRGGEKEGYIQVEGSLGDAEFQRLQGQILEGWDQAKERGRTRILTSGAKFESTGGAARDLMFPQLLGLSKTDIAEAFGVPGAVLGEGSSNYATFHGERRKFWEHTILPMMELVCQTLRTDLIARLRDSRLREAYPYFDTSHVRALREDQASQVESVKGFQDAGVPLATAIEVVGLEGIDAASIPGADVPLIRSGLMRLEDVIAGLSAPPPDAPSADAPAGDTEDDAPNADEGETEAEGDGAAKRMPLAMRLRIPTPTDTPEEELREWYAQNEKRREEGDARIAKAVRKVWRAARRDQLAHLEAMAKDAAENEPSDKAAPIYSEPLPAASFLQEFRAAWAKDMAATSAVRKANPKDGRLWSVVRTCTGDELLRLPAEVHDARAALAEEAGDFGGMQRVQDLVLLRFLDLTEAEIDQLLVLQQAGYAEQIAQALGTVYQSVYQDAATALGKATELPVIGLTNPAKIQALKNQGIKLANDVSGTLSKQVRSAMIRTFAENQDTVGTLREKVRQLLGPLQDATRETFNQADRRALTIARTETTFVDGQATYDQHVAWADEGRMLTHEWVAKQPNSPPGRTRETHVALHATKVKVGEPWTSSGALLFFPGDKSSNVPGEFVNCFPAETTVSAAGIEAGYERWYEGDMVSLHLASGRVLTVTPNHPLLGDGGWRAAGAFDVGDDLVRCGIPDLGSVADPDVQRPPASFGQVLGALAMVGESRRVSGLNVNLHGDGKGREVEVVRSHGELRVGLDAALLEHLGQLDFPGADLDQGLLAPDRHLVGVGSASRPAARRGVSGLRQGGALLRGGLAHPDEHRLGPVPRSNSSLEQTAPDGRPINGEALRERLLGLASHVSTDEIVHVELHSFSGHVYNLQTRSGWYIADGIVAHNCRCGLKPRRLRKDLDEGLITQEEFDELLGLGT